ncbi:hypothetical protein NODU109028_00165 [Nocardioides dubius]
MLLLLIVIAVVIYLVVRTVETRGHPFRRPPGRRPSGGGRGPSRPVAPDDDPEFLRDLNRRRKKRDPDSPE